jgi:hypothetical protein
MVLVRASRAHTLAFLVCLACVGVFSSSPAAAACGDLVIQAGEDCDDGGNNGTLNSCCTTSCTFSGESPDVIVGDITTPSRWGTLNGITAYSIGTTSCNVGNCWLNWISGTPEHPVIGQNMFRLKDGRFEHVGQAWLKHGFTALQGTVCGSCNPAGTGARLGIGCSDPYDSGLNGGQHRLGPKQDVNPSSGVFLYPDGRIQLTGNAIYKRLQVKNTDLDPVLNPGSLYFLEGQYVTHDDAEAKNNSNNASWRQVAVGAAPNYSLSLQGTTQRQKAGIQAWKTNDPSVTETAVASDGLFLLGAKVTALGGGLYHYEYAVQNLTSHRAAKSFTVPLPPGAVVTNIGFHDVDYHSGEPFDGTDWPATILPGSITWSTSSFETNPNANALRWGTLYNFRFDANVPPGTSPVTLGLFRPGAPATISSPTVTPETCAAAPNGTACSDGNGCTTSDTCLAGACVGTNPVICAPIDACHDAGICDPGTGACSNPNKPDGTSCNDGSACTPTDACQSGACVGQNPVVCAPLDSCHDAGICDPGTGACSNPVRPNGSPCDDANGCTTGDACQAGSCQAGSPVVCAPLDSCHDAGVCDLGTGACSNPAKPDGTPCDDASGCTANDACSAGACTGDGVPAPGEVEGAVQFDHSGGVTTITWTPASGSTSSSVLRGSLGLLPVGPGGADEVCLGGGNGTSITDDSDPFEGQGYWYLVQGVNSCGAGSYGYQYENGVPTTPRESTTCP